MCDESKGSLVTNKKERIFFLKISRFWMRLLDRYFILNDMIKSIKIFLKKQFIKICIFFDTKRLFISYKKY